MCIPDTTSNDVIKMILDAIDSFDLTIKRIIKSSIASMAEVNANIKNDEHFLVIDLCDKLTYLLFEKGFKETKRKSFDFSSNHIVDIIENCTISKLKRRNGNFDMTHEEKNKLRMYSHVAARRLLLTEKFDWEIPNIVSDNTHMETLAQPRIFIYTEDLIDAITDELFEFMKEEGISESNLKQIVLTNLAICIPYTYVAIADYFNEVKKCDIAYCTGSLKGAIKVSLDTTKYPTLSTDLKEIPIGSEKLEFIE